MRLLVIAAICVTLEGCAASAPEVRARLGQQYIGKNVDVLVVRWGPPISTFRLNSGQNSYVWQLASETDIVGGNRSASATTYACKVSIITSSSGVIEQLDTEDHNAGLAGSGLIDGLAATAGAFGSMCAQRLDMKPQG